jgi:hypothetical protein
MEERVVRDDVGRLPRRQLAGSAATHECLLRRRGMSIREALAIVRERNANLKLDIKFVVMNGVTIRCATGQDRIKCVVTNILPAALYRRTR